LAQKKVGRSTAKPIINPKQKTNITIREIIEIMLQSRLIFYVIREYFNDEFGFKRYPCEY
ncbi:hypothetical protein ACLS0P_10365, partial [Avibacterium avium]